MISISTHIHRPVALYGYSGFYHTICHPDVMPEISLKGTPEEQATFSALIDNLMAKINVLQTIDCEVGLMIETSPKKHLITGIVEAWSESLADKARTAISDIREAFEQMRAFPNDSSATINLSFCRTVKRGQKEA